MNYLKNKFGHYFDKEFRPGQEKAIDFLVNSTTKVRVLCAPTGTGKSLIGMCAGAAFKSFTYLCSSKQLQTQIIRDFPEAKILWGRNNYDCLLLPGRKADRCIHPTIKCQYKGDCPYEIQKTAVLNSDYRILNYSYFITEANYIGKFSGQSALVCDEADTLESHLSSFINVRFTKHTLDKLRLDLPRYVTTSSEHSLDDWKEWAKDTMGKISKRVSILTHTQKQLEPESESFSNISKELQSLDTLKSRLLTFIKYVDKTWLLDARENESGQLISLEFKPTWIPPDLSNEYFFRHAKNIMMMSATWPPVGIIAKTLGLQLKDISYLESSESAFPASSRPVILHPSGDMSYKTFHIAIHDLIRDIKDILSDHPNEKGVIHTVSWKLNNIIMGDINNTRLITHNSDNKVSVLTEFMTSKDPLVFVSPSSMRGLDLPDDLCRFQIIAKMPFQSLGDKLVKARCYTSQIGNHWYASDAAQELVQASGRANRHRHDYCKTYILDSQAVSRVIKNKHLFPNYYIDACDLDFGL